MKFTLKRDKLNANTWNGISPLPDTISVISPTIGRAEFELLAIICAIHGHVTAYDLISGANTNSEKDNDITSIMSAFECYIHPNLPLSNYTYKDKRIKEPITPSIAIDSTKFENMTITK